MSYFQTHLEGLAGYVPGEQPRRTDLVKLNTNESPYPPSPRVIEAIERAARGRLNRYPDPLAREFTHAAGEALGVDPTWIVAVNGSDEALMLLTRACCGPGDAIAAPAPSYLLYRILANIQGCRYLEQPFLANGDPPDDFGVGAKLSFVPNPNSPTGHAIPAARMRRLAERAEGLLVVDEAYADFADDHCILQVAACERLVVARTFSKGYALAGLRFGYVVAQPPVAEMLRTIKDSYNCDALSIAGAAAAIRDQEWLRDHVRRIRATRARLATALEGFGFRVTPSAANFVWARRDAPVKPVYELLKERGILIRHLHYGSLGEGLRVSVGTDAEIDRLIDELRRIV